MKLAFEPYGAEHVPAVLALNDRLESAGAAKPYFPTTPRPGRFPPPGVLPNLFQELFVAREGEAVRGGYALKQQEFSFETEEGGARPAAIVGAFQIPVSEGAVEKRYSLLGLHLLRDALARNPLLYTLGIGGRGEPFARMLESARWRLIEVPFYFRVLQGGPFFRNMAYLRSTPARRQLFDALAWAQVPGLALPAVHRLRSRRGSTTVRTEKVESFGSWATELWEQCQGAYAFAATRTGDVLDTLYPPGEGDFVRLRFSKKNGTTVAWTLLLSHRLRAHRHFGDLHLGTLVDGAALPGYEAAAVRASTRFLQEDGAELVVSNQAHEGWCRGLERGGFFRGPSNFLFAASPRLAERLDLENPSRLHLNRGDGDGPINL